MGTWEKPNGSAEGEPERFAQRFEDLRVWQTARELAKGVYRAAETRRLRQDWALRQQMRKAAISIGSNIAEGYERGTRKQFIEFCFIAKGSAGELRSQIITAHDVGLLDEAAYKWLSDKAEECSRQLAAFIRHLQRTERTIPGLKHHYAGEATPNA